MKPGEALTLALVLGGAFVLSSWLRTQSPPGDAEQAAQLRSLLQAQAPIEMISSVHCAYCTRARLWFEEHDVPFKECFVERDAACKTRWQQTGARATPTFVVKGRAVLGLDLPQLIDVLKTQ